jgi:hypothetical protein
MELRVNITPGKFTQLKEHLYEVNRNLGEPQRELRIFERKKIPS